MDEEADFTNLLSQSSIPTRPTWASNEPSSPDPWANPFSSESPNNPFASATSPYGSTSVYVPGGTTQTLAPAARQQSFRLDPESPTEEVSPYVTKLEEDDKYGRGTLPDPPSVIAAREHEANEAVFTNPYADDDINGGFAQTPYSPPINGTVQAQSPSQSPTIGTVPTSPPSRKLPSDLIDEDLLAARDPSVSLKKAFVKSTAAPRAAQKSPTKVAEEKKAYVFTPGGKASTPKPMSKKEEKKVEIKEEKNQDEQVATPKQEVKEEPKTAETKEEAVKDEEKASTSKEDIPRTTPTPTDPVTKVAEEPKPDANTAPSEIPLPSSAQTTPSLSRVPSPVPAPAKKGTQSSMISSASDVFSSTPSHDRVAVSPLDAPPPAEQDYGFQSLSIGGAGTSTSTANAQPPALPPKTATPTTTWDTKLSATSSRFAGKGWGALDEEDDLFGPGGPSVRSDPWGGGGVGAGTSTASTVMDTDGWADPQIAASSEAGPSQVSHACSDENLAQAEPSDVWTECSQLAFWQ